MKNVMIIVVMMLIAVGIWFLKFNQPAPAKAYYQYKSSIMEPQKQTVENFVSSLAKWELKIDSCKTSGDTATIIATEKQYNLPPNSASLVFANITIDKLQVQMVKNEGRWELASEEIIDTTTSTYEQRKDSK